MLAVDEADVQLAVAQGIDPSPVGALRGPIDGFDREQPDAVGVIPMPGELAADPLVPRWVVLDAEDAGAARAQPGGAVAGTPFEAAVGGAQHPLEDLVGRPRHPRHARIRALIAL